jgi:hypothetical protein
VIKNLQDKIDCLQEELRGRGKEIAQLESALFVVWKKTQRNFLSAAPAPENRSASAEPTLTRFAAASRLFGNGGLDPAASRRPHHADPLPRDALVREGDPHARLLRRLFPPIAAAPPPGATGALPRADADDADGIDDGGRAP